MRLLLGSSKRSLCQRILRVWWLMKRTTSRIQTLLGQRVRSLLSKVPRAVLMTGTPLENRLDEFVFLLVMSDQNWV